MNTKVIYPKVEGQRNLYKSIQEKHQSEYGEYVTTRSVPTGEIEKFTYEVSIDLDYIRDMGRRAATNKNGKCQAGGLKVKILKKETE